MADYRQCRKGGQQQAGSAAHQRNAAGAGDLARADATDRRVDHQLVERPERLVAGVERSAVGKGVSRGKTGERGSYSATLSGASGGNFRSVACARGGGV